MHSGEFGVQSVGIIDVPIAAFLEVALFDFVDRLFDVLDCSIRDVILPFDSVDDPIVHAIDDQLIQCTVLQQSR